MLHNRYYTGTVSNFGILLALRSFFCSPTYHFPSPLSHTQPLYPFGYGISLTTFNLTMMQTSASSDVTELTTTENVRVSYQVKVTNTGSRPGDEVVFGFDKPTNVSHHLKDSKLIQQLGFFQRVHLEPGQSIVVDVTVPTSAFSMVDARGDRVVAPGEHDFVITNRVDQEIVRKVVLRGPVAVIDKFLQ